MPRFYFDVFDGNTNVTDEDGLDVVDVTEVSNLAIEALPEIAREQLPDGNPATFVVTVRDETGASIYQATLEFSARWLRRNS